MFLSSSSSSSSSPPLTNSQPSILGQNPNDSSLSQTLCLTDSSSSPLASQSVLAHSQLPLNVVIDGDDDPMFTELMLSLLARREVEQKMVDRLHLRAEKTRTRHLKYVGIAVDQSDSLEYCLALAESIPSGLKEPQLHISDPINTSDRLPGERGTDAPHEQFLNLGFDVAGKNADAFTKLQYALVLEEFALELLAPHLPTIRERKIRDAYDAVSPSNFLPSENLNKSVKTFERNQSPQKFALRESRPPYFMNQSAVINKSKQGKLFKKTRTRKAAPPVSKKVLFTSDDEYSSDSIENDGTMQSQQPMEDASVKQGNNDALAASEDHSFNGIHGCLNRLV